MTRLLSTLVVAIFTVTVGVAQDARVGLPENGPLTSNQWVQLSEAGEFQGRIFVLRHDGSAVPVSQASVTIRSVDEGSFHAESVTDALGEFTIPGVGPGVYTLASSSENASSHQAIQVIDSSIDLGGQYPRVAEIAATPLTYRKFRKIVRAYQPGTSAPIISMATADFEALTGAIINNDTYRVLRVDDGMSGRIHRAGGYGKKLMPAIMTNVFVYRGNLEVARDVTDRNGDFRIDHLTVGTYSLLAIGPDGAAAIGFELVAADANRLSVQTEDGKHFVNKLAAANGFGCQVSPLGEGDGDGGGEGDEDGDGSPQTRFAGGGGPGSGMGGGGGGGGGGGSGLGNVAALAGLAGVAAAAASGDNGGVIVVPPSASPAIPSESAEVPAGDPF